MPSSIAHAAISGFDPHRRNNGTVHTSTEQKSVALTATRRKTGFDPDSGAAAAMFPALEKRVLFTDWAMI